MGDEETRDNRRAAVNAVKELARRQAVKAVAANEGRSQARGPQASLVRQANLGHLVLRSLARSEISSLDELELLQRPLNMRTLVLCRLTLSVGGSSFVDRF